MKVSTRQLGRFALVMAPTFGIIVAILTALEWDFLHDHGWGLVHAKSSSIAWPSGTADGRFGWVQVANFALLGLAVLGLAVALRRSVAARARLAPLLLGAMGLALLACMPKTDEGDSPQTWHGYVHAIASLTLFALSIVTVPLVWRWLRRDPAWMKESRASAVTAVFVAGGLVGSFLENGSIAFCVYLAALLVWIAMLGARAAG
jgi:hypothetical protein